MFGYITTNMEQLTLEEKQRYGACYCGLCKSLKTRHGQVSRLVLTYDMTFIVLVLSSLYKKDADVQTERCMVHPIKPHRYWQNEFTDFAADMNVAMAYYNFIDDWVDDKNILALCEAKLFKHHYNQVAMTYKKQCAFIEESLKALTLIENSGELNPDIPANCFGKLMGELFVLKEDEYANDLRAFGHALGKFIYIMDACLDLKDDIKHERYNPLITTPSQDFKDILNILMADCTNKYEALPIEQDKQLIENILYSGVWANYEAKIAKENSKK